MPIFTVDDTGVHAPSLETALADTRQQLADIFGDDLANADQTPQGQLAGIIAVLEAVIGEALVRLGNATSVNDAVGTQLDTLGELLDILRQRPTRSRVTATVTGVAGTNLPAASRARTSDGDVFRTVADVALAPSPGVSVEMEAVDEGAVRADAGTLTNIVTVVAGWETITNPAAAIIGVPQQGDPEYRTAYRRRTAHRAIGSVDAIRSAIDEALGGKQNVKENFEPNSIVEQEFTVYRSHVLAVVQSGTDATIQRAIETARGMGTGTMTAIVGGTPDSNALDSVNNGTVNWNGTDYTGLDLTGSGTDALKAAALTTLLAGDPVPPVVAAIDGVYIAQYAWSPTATPAFGTGTVATDFGFGADAVVSPGPFIRTRTRALTVTLAVTRQPGFPGDGLDRIRAAATAVATGYGVGQQVWANDFLQAVESIGGTRVTAITVQYNGADVSGLAVPLDVLWLLPFANLTVVIT